MSQKPTMSESDASAVIHSFRQRLIAIVEKPPYRYVNTSSEDRAAYEAQKRSFRGYSDDEIDAAESRLKICFPAVYRAYLRIMGASHGDLFCGLNVASLHDYDELREFAKELLNENNVDFQLDEKAVVFVEHQGYSFCYFIADGGFDSPVFQYVEGDRSAKECGDGFGAMIDSEVKLMENNNRTSREAGGYFLTVQNGYVTQNRPALSSGVRPLDLPEEDPGDSSTEIADARPRSWWRFWKNKE